MNIKFEWVQEPDCLHTLYVGESKWGSAMLGLSASDQWVPCLYLTGEWKHEIPTLDEAKAWVEEQARAWLAEVTA